MSNNNSAYLYIHRRGISKENHKVPLFFREKQFYVYKVFQTTTLQGMVGSLISPQLIERTKNPVMIHNVRR